MVTLPDGTTRSPEEVFAIIALYCKRWPAVFALYDQSNSGPHDEVLPIDLLAPNALNAWGKGQPMTAMTNAWLVRNQITSAVAPISKAPLEELSDVEAEAEAEKVGAALEMIDSIRGYGDTAASKFFHRFRPNLGPIWDKWVGDWYSDSGGWTPRVKRVYAHVREAKTLLCLKASRDHFCRSLPILRVWDVLLWQIKKGSS